MELVEVVWVEGRQRIYTSFSGASERCGDSVQRSDTKVTVLCTGAVEVCRVQKRSRSFAEYCSFSWRVTLYFVVCVCAQLIYPSMPYQAVMRVW